MILQRAGDGRRPGRGPVDRRGPTAPSSPFSGGATASLAYSGYGRFDSDEFCGWIGETGAPKDPLPPRGSLQTLRESATPEADRRRARAYGEAGVETSRGAPGVSEHFGLVIASCEHADLRITPEGVLVYGEGPPRLHRPEPSVHPRSTVVDEIWGAVVEGREPPHSGAWGMATLEACLAIRESSRLGREIIMEARHGEA